MGDQYDADMVAQYDRSFVEIPLRRYVELPSVSEMLGDVTGLSILDLACGTGYYAKALRRRGAARMPEQSRDGLPFVFSVTLGEYTSPELTAYYWSKDCLESALHGATLTDVRWMVPMPSAGGIEMHGAGFWADVVRAPFEMIVTCQYRGHVREPLRSSWHGG